MWRSALLLTFVALLVAVCGPPPTASIEPSAGPVKVTITDATRGELEAVLQKKADAARRQDLSAFQSTIDLSRSTFRRCWTEAFEETGRGSAPSWVNSAKIVKLEPYLDTYVRAYVDEPGLGVARRYFRKEGTRWVLTEPKDDELGGERKKTVDGLELSYWGVDDDIIDLLGKEGLATRSFLQTNARGATRTPFALRFFPTRSTAGLQAACRALGTSQINDPRDPFLRFFGAWLAPSLDQVSDDMRATFKHEGLHWLQDQFIPGISARLDFWLVEGWPDFVGGVDRGNSIRRLLCGGGSAVPAYKQLADGPSQEAGTRPEVVSQYYAYANSMIDYLYAQFGKDAYWDLMTTYKDGVNPNENLPKVIKATPDRFREGWLAFAMKKYC